MSWIKNSFIILILTLCCLLLIEVFFRNINQDINDQNLKEWMESKPKAFRNDPNFTNILKTLDGTCKWPPFIHANGSSFYSNDFECGKITYKNGKRVTIPIPDEWKKTIHIFGGSTLFGTGSVDAFTIPSIIQKNILNKDIRVLNYGISTYVVRQQNNALNFFKKDIQKDDIVIYYDGGNDFWNGVMLGNFDGDMIGFNQKNKSQLFQFIIRSWLSQNSETYQYLSDLKHGRSRKSYECDVNVEVASGRVAESAMHYSKKVNEAKAIVNNLGAKFYHFYQPTLFDSHAPTSYEKEVLLHNPCWAKAMLFRKDYNNIFFEVSKNSFDLTNILLGKDLFFDYIHVSAKGNVLISEAILNEIQDVNGMIYDISSKPPANIEWE